VPQRGPVDEVGQHVVEPRVPLRRVAVARQDAVLGVQALREDIADASKASWWPPETTSFGNGAARAPRAGSRPPRPALRDEGARTLLELGRQGEGGSKSEPTACRKARRRPPGRLAATLPQLRAAAGEGCDGRIVERDRVHGGSITVSDRTGSPPRRREQADDTAVGVADQVIALADLRAEHVCLLLEVHALHRRVRREARPFQHDKVEPVSSGRCVLHV